MLKVYTHYEDRPTENDDDKKAAAVTIIPVTAAVFASF